jgi:hypothetical protein
MSCSASTAQSAVSPTAKSEPGPGGRGEEASLLSTPIPRDRVQRRARRWLGSSRAAGGRRPDRARATARAWRSAMRRNGSRGGALHAYLREVESVEIEATLGRHGWNVSATARELGVSRVGLTKRLQTLGIERPRELPPGDAPEAETPFWPCPRCGAAAGEACRFLLTSQPRSPHRERREPPTLEGVMRREVSSGALTSDRDDGGTAIDPDDQRHGTNSHRTAYER